MPPAIADTGPDIPPGLPHEPVKVLLVCTGNICRSPTAEGVLRAMADQAGLAAALTIDSCGLQGYHVGDPPDPRAIDTAATNGLDISGLRARRFRAEDYAQFHYILGMDGGHLRQLKMMTPKKSPVRIGLLGDYATPRRIGDIADPYYGPIEGFAAMYDEICRASSGLLAHIQREDLT